MPVIIKICAALMLMMLVRCPSVAQQMSSRLASLSFNCTEGNTLIKNKSKRRMISAKEKTFLSLGLEYKRATTLADPSALTIEKQYRIGLPLLAGYRLGNCTLEAGGFFGVNMSRPQESFWFANPETAGGTINRSLSPAATLMLAIGYNFNESGSLNLRYLHLDDLPDTNILGNFQLGWTWNW
jgi:hypothetical protein